MSVREKYDDKLRQFKKRHTFQCLHFFNPFNPSAHDVILSSIRGQTHKNWRQFVKLNDLSLSGGLLVSLINTRLLQFHCFVHVAFSTFLL